MFNKFARFWTTFFGSVIKKMYERFFPPPEKRLEQPWRDVLRINMLAIFVNKLNNLVNSEATFEVVSDSAQTDRLKELCKDVESKRFQIADNMLADGDYFIFPATNRNGQIIHSYLTQSQVRILDTDSDEIREAYGIIDWFKDDRSRVFYLVRHHILDDAGTLTISYDAYDESGKTVEVEKWADVINQAYLITNANHIGFGRYKSPTSDRGLSPIYGVPLNFGCAEIEKDIFEDYKLLRKEFKNAASKMFVDETIAKTVTDDKGKTEYEVTDNVYTYRPRAGQSGNFVDIYNPTIRSSEHFEKIEADYAAYEQQVGTSRGILTKNETANATATEVKRANADTISLMGRIRTAIDAGNKMTLEADAVFLNIASDLWTYSSDWYDPFEDAGEQWQRLIEGKANGAVETSDITKWLFPQLTAEEVEEKLERIGTSIQNDTETAIDRILAGR